MKKDLEPMILEILSHEKVKNQTVLASLLLERGMRTDQSNLSRHLKKLGIEKKGGFYYLEGKSSAGLTITPVPPNLVVVKTLPGHAQALAFKLDHRPLKGLVGTIAGDDTILCIIESPKFMKPICKQLHHVE